MALQNPVPVYLTPDMGEADTIRQALESLGIAAHVTIDISQTGLGAVGPVPDPQGYQVWVERDQAERAGPVLAKYERQAAADRGRHVDADAGPVVVVCDKCGESTTFPAEQRDTVQECPNCLAYLDVAPSGEDADWGEPEPDTTADEEPH